MTGLIDRADLVAALDRAAASRVTVLSAPAGSGKTCLLRAWAEGPTRPRRLAVVQVSRDEHDAQTFWLAVLAAVRRADGAAGRSDAPVPTPDVDPQAVAERVLAELADAGDGVTVVIDDLHELRSPDALAPLARLLTALPPGAHAVLATRRDLRLGLHRLRLAGELAELRAADLRFTDKETRLLLDAAGVQLSDPGRAVLQQRTEGWAAGLRLAALSLVGHPDPERFVADFSGTDRTVAEYLLAEMLERQPDDVQRLLLRTSLLDRVNGELADLMTGLPGSERTLLDLEDANAFVVSLDPQRTWFRYHHLFADLLKLELRRTVPEEVPALHRRAAGWLLEHGQVVDAIRHTQAGGDWTTAAQLLADHSFGLTLDGRTQTIESLLGAFPPGADGDSSDLAIAHATTDLTQGRLDGAAAHLAVADAHVGTTPPERRHRLQVAIAALKLSLARRRGSLADVLEQAGFLTAPATGRSDGEVALDNDLRAVGLMNLGIVEAWALGTEDAERHLLEGAALARENGRTYLEVACMAQLAFASKIHPIAITRRRCQDAIARAEELGWGAEPILAPALVALAGAMALTGNLEDAQRRLDRAARALRSDSGPGIRLLLQIGEGMLHAGCGRLPEAAEAFAAAESLRSQLVGSHVLANQVTGWLLVTRARLGLTGEARAALGSLDRDQASAGEIRNGSAAVSLADGDPTAALEALRGVLDGTAPVIGYVAVIEAHLLAARAHRDLGDRRAANRAVEAALALAEPDRVVLPFAMTGAGEVLQDLPRHETAHTSLLGDVLDVLRGASASAEDEPVPAAERLSPTELRVLRYLPTNLSRPEIAGELCVSVNTVNTHIRNIFAKLQVPNRTAAVQRARRLRLIGAGRAG